jgi:predicted Zn finger-like uncharacterized protein
MLIVCPSCATAYNVDVASLQPSGRQVRCVRCRTVWHAEPTRADKLLAAAGAISPPRDLVQDPLKSVVEELVPSQPPQRPAVAADEDERPNQPANEATTDAQPSDAPAGESPPPAGENGVPSQASNAAAEVEAPPIAPVDFDEGKPAIDVAAGPASAHDDEPRQDIETYAARRRRRSPSRKSLRWPLSRLQNGIAALLIIDAVLVAWRNDIVRVLPQTASFYAMLGLGVNLRGLAFDGVTTTTEMRDGVPILVVEGSIVNVDRNIVDVPRLKFAARNAAGEEIYSWTAVPPRTTLPPQETVAFRSRLASPPPELRDVLVRFVTRRDIISETR